jgi:hypothetical protein
MVTLSNSGIVVNDANVISADIMAINGVIHVINKVLLPPSSQMMTTTTTMAMMKTTTTGGAAADDCLPDWFDNEQMDLVDPTINFKKLYPGQFICSRSYSVNWYRSGVTQLGNIVWTDTAPQGETKILFENKNSHDIYFLL